jgi:hypothetical protein
MGHKRTILFKVHKSLFQIVRQGKNVNEVALHWKRKGRTVVCIAVILTFKIRIVISSTVRYLPPGFSANSHDMRSFYDVDKRLVVYFKY